MTYINGKNITLKLLTPDDVGKEYLSWFDDYETIQYTESKYNRYTINQLKEYVLNINKTHDNFLYGIYKDNAHIGNIKIGSINWIHRYGDIGIIIGNSSMRGKGYAKESIELICEISFNNLGLNKLNAGVYATNQASIHLFHKSGFKKIGTQIKHVFFNGEWIDVVLFERHKYENI